MKDTTAPDTVPSDHSARTIVLCFDGTQNKISDQFSNVAKFFGLLDRRDRSKQMVYYQTGIGTYTSSKFFLGPISSKIAMTYDSMVATTLAQHVKEGYRYLMDNYVQGNHICIFGFSRGAHTARVLAAMIHEVGLLPVGNHRHIDYAWDVYSLTSKDAARKTADFKTSFAMDVKIEFVGIWDSVGSVGFTGTRCSFSPNNDTIKHFRHAVALDERRARFQANTWMIKDRKKEMYKTDVEEVWFAGCHSDVGGGNCDTHEPHSLSRISLRWMVRQCFQCDTGIIFMVDPLRKIGLDPFSLQPGISQQRSQVSTSGDDEKTLDDHEEDRLDAKCRVNDELEKPWWWILELVPILKSRPMPDGSWKKDLVMNLGKARYVATQGDDIKIHRSVKMKMVEPGSKYKPRAFFPGEPTWAE